jgi:hypothetical protein
MWRTPATRQSALNTLADRPGVLSAPPPLSNSVRTPLPTESVPLFASSSRRRIEVRNRADALPGAEKPALARVTTAARPAAVGALAAAEIKRYEAAIEFAAGGGSGLKTVERSLIGELMQTRLESGAAAFGERPDQTREARCSSRGDFWIVGFARDEQLVRDGKGLHHLAYLLRYPNRAISALDLIAHSGAYRAACRKLAPVAAQDRELALEALNSASAAEAFGAAGELLDRRALVEYRSRRKQIVEELTEAKRLGHEQHAIKLERELDWLERELRRAIGIGGRARAAAKVAEQARINVTRALRSAIERIVAATPALGRHLEVSVKTGSACCYRTDLDRPVRWII